MDTLHTLFCSADYNPNNYSTGDQTAEQDRGKKSKYLIIAFAGYKYSDSIHNVPLNQHIIHNKPLSGVRHAQTAAAAAAGLQFDGSRVAQRSNWRVIDGERTSEFAVCDSAMLAARVTNDDCQLARLPN